MKEVSLFVLMLVFLWGLTIALSCKDGPSVGITRMIHLIFGHPRQYLKMISTTIVEEHPQNTKDLVFKVHVMECSKCGLIHIDLGHGDRPK